MLTFLEVGFGGNLVQGFRAYAWRAVPSFPQIALWGPSFTFWPQPLRICLLRLPNPRALHLTSHHKSTSDRHHSSVDFTLVSIGINHHFARCLRLPIKEFNMRKFVGNICSLTSCLFVHSFNKHWWSSSWLHVTKEIVSNFRRSHSPVHSKKSPPSYSHVFLG